MPRFYFHYRCADDRVVEDHLGSDQSDIESVEREAHLIASDILEEELRRGVSMSVPRCLEIEDEKGEIVLYVPFWASLLPRRGTDATMVH